MAKLFGTDGIRGVANRYPMTPEIALKVGRATAHFFKGRAERFGDESIILIGKDTRRSSYMIEQALAAGITSEGCTALLVGPMPTPGVAFLTRSMRADAGVMVSASHNPFEYNGIKLFGHNGFKLPDHVEKEIEALVLSDSLEKAPPTGGGLGLAKRIEDAMGRYIVHVKRSLNDEFDLKGMRVVIDSAHGAAYKCARYVFNELGAEVFQVGAEPNGININDKVGALYPERVAELVRKYRADIGIALDGDADRVIFSDEKGAIADGDQIMAILAIDAKNRGRLKNDAIVATKMSNIGLELALKARGINVLKADVGDRAVVDMMRSHNVVLGGEQSGHIVDLQYSTTGDGISTALSILRVMKEVEEPLSHLRAVVTPFPQVLKNIRVKSKPPLDHLSPVQKLIRKFEEELGQEGRLLVRYSGTEPVCRVMVEGRNDKRIEEMAGEICQALSSALNEVDS